MRPVLIDEASLDWWALAGLMRPSRIDEALPYWIGPAVLYLSVHDCICPCMTVSVRAWLIEAWLIEAWLVRHDWFDMTGSTWASSSRRHLSEIRLVSRLYSLINTEQEKTLLEHLQTKSRGHYSWNGVSLDPDVTQ